MARHVRKGDQVIITSGALKGTVGTILRVITDNDRVILKGINLRTKHLKPTRLNPQGGVVTREAPIHISNVSPIVDGKPTRVRVAHKPDGSKVRVAARNGQELGVIRGKDAKKGVTKTHPAKQAGKPAQKPEHARPVAKKK